MTKEDKLKEAYEKLILSMAMERLVLRYKERVKDMGSNYGEEYLRNKITLKLMLGGCLNGWNSHHIVPYYISKDNSIANLCYIKIERHEALHLELEKLKGKKNKPDYFRIARRYGAIGLELN